jgi:hypothetical protein
MSHSQGLGGPGSSGSSIAAGGIVTPQRLNPPIAPSVVISPSVPVRPYLNYGSVGQLIRRTSTSLLLVQLKPCQET